jgi:Mlc titration factor MtfA (ptsG expression regulator)
LLIIQPWKKTNVPAVTTAPESLRTILENEVPFYQKLDADQKINFEQRASGFLSQVRITGVKTTVEDIDRVLIAASAIIPIFNFPGWQYRNLHEVLLYPDAFDHDYAQQGEGRTILGMVGSGAMNHIMILSQFQLRQAFSNKTAKDNTAIHEFVHLIDKTDGDIDGIPEALLDKKYIIPWLELVEKEMDLIKEGESDINPYGATNHQEFLSVVAEYFFERPDLLQQKHPELYALLLKIFGKP